MVSEYWYVLARPPLTRRHHRAPAASTEALPIKGKLSARSIDLICLNCRPSEANLDFLTAPSTRLVSHSAPPNDVTAGGGAQFRINVVNLEHKLTLNQPFFGAMGCTCAIVFTCLGAAYGTAKSGVGIAAMGVLRPDLIVKSTASTP